MKNLNKFISVIIPVYKAENSLKKCVDSVLQQSYTNFELILVDDGSPDRSPAICDEYAEKDGKIKVVHKENGGAGDARNAGLDVAQGEFIAFVDSDDYLERDFLINAVQKTEDADFYISGITMCTKDSKNIYVPSISGRFSAKETLEKCFAEIPLICLSGPWCKLFRTDIIKNENIRFDVNLTCGEDTDFNLSYLLKTSSVYIDDRNFYNYSLDNPDSLFNRYNPCYYEEHKRLYDKWLRVLTELNCSPVAVMAVKKRHILSLISNIDHAFTHDIEKSERKKVIQRISKDKSIKSGVKIKGKNGIIRTLLKYRLNCFVYILYSIRYRKKK